MFNWPIESWIFLGALVAWHLVPFVTGLLRLHLVRPLVTFRQNRLPAPPLTEEQLRLRRQLRAEKAGERLEIGYGSVEEVIESMRR